MIPNLLILTSITTTFTWKLLVILVIVKPYPQIDFTSLLLNNQTL